MTYHYFLDVFGDGLQHLLQFRHGAIEVVHLGGERHVAAGRVLASLQKIHCAKTGRNDAVRVSDTFYTVKEVVKYFGGQSKRRMRTRFEKTSKQCIRHFL